MSLPQGLSPLPKGAIVFGPKTNCTIEICDPRYSVPGLQPSLAANSLFIALFAIAGIIHLYLGWRWKSWFFMWCMIVGCISGIVGYAGRILLHYNPFSFRAFLVQTTCVITAPIYFCAAIYVTLALTIEYLSPELSRFKPKLFYWIFIPCDLLALLIQAAGGGLSTSSQGKSQMGVDLALAGLALQVTAILAFCGFMLDFLWRYSRSQHANKEKISARLKIFLTFLAISILLILTRCAYRLAELHEGYRGELVRDEPLYILFEGV
ncbi:hypothetical protein KVT40_008432 [Elsinoe batatas]|uniref:Sphingoid long-chain base transporter RSB1 n=1 Tax=Elsinoe batatas TaxID=2601811 RepID=A0A8K0KT60_9PEZI|nr:hypothetical protein KVT40_008432 [Elsinoe batatas]